MNSLADIIAYNDAHADDALKYGQTQLIASQAVDLAPGSADTPPTWRTGRRQGRQRARRSTTRSRAARPTRPTTSRRS